MIVLASASPRRQDLLRQAGIRFTVQPADIDESPHAGEAPRQCAERLAREKALVISHQRPQDTVLGADTIVVIDETILGKPSDVDAAARMLRLLSGRVHRVITGVCLARPAGRVQGAAANEGAASQSQLRSCQTTRTADRELTIASETTLVTMSKLSDEEIREYAASSEPMDKAGAYAIQGMASRWIPRIEGDYCNVVGLPVALVYRMLREAGEV
jgi:septum formation protein